MTTKTVQAYFSGIGYDLSYRGKLVTTCHDMEHVESWAKLNGFTHVNWLKLPIGKGNTRTKIK